MDSFGFIVRYDRRIDDRPTTDVDRRDVIGKASEPAATTGELRLTDPVSLIDVTTNRTGAAGVPRIDQVHGDARAFRFVCHEGAELVKRPSVQGCPLKAMNRDPRPYPFQIFQGDRSICAFRFGNQLFTDAVVSIFGKTAFLARKLLEFSFGRPRAPGLQLRPQASMTVANVIYVTSRVDFSIAVYGDVRHPKIHTKNAFHIDRFGFVDIASGGKEEQPFAQPQITFPLPRLE
jgi:hypothetical protein